MANLVNQNEYSLDQVQGFGGTSRIQQKTQYRTETEEINKSVENSPQQEKLKSQTQLRNEAAHLPQLNKNHIVKSMSLASQVDSKDEVKMNLKIHQSVQSRVFDDDNMNHENSQVVMQISVNNENAQTADWVEQTPPMQKQRDNFSYKSIDQVRVRKTNTDYPKQNINLNHDDIHGPVILMPSRQTFSAADKFSALGSLRPVTRSIQKKNYPQTQKSNRRQLITNGIFLPSENLVLLKGNTVANTIEKQRPVVTSSKRISMGTIPDTNHLKLESQKLQPENGVLLHYPGKIDKSQLDQNLSYAFEITSRPKTNSKNLRNHVVISQKSRTIESRCVTLRDLTFNSQILVSDSIMRQRLGFSYNPKQPDVEVKARAQINQKLMDNSFGRLESTSPEMPRRVECAENKQTSLLAATLYERTGNQVSLNKKTQQYKLKRPFYQEASFDPSFAAYQDGGQKVKSASQTLTEKAKRMEFEGNQQIQSQQINAKDRTSDPKSAQIFQAAVDSRRASFVLDEEVKQTPNDLNRESQTQPNEVLFYGNKKVQSKYTQNVLDSQKTQKPAQITQQSFQSPATFQRTKASSSRVGTSGNHKYAISDIQIQKPTGSSEALNQQLLQQQAYFQQQRALINQITHQNSKVLKEKAQDESQKVKPQTLRNKSSSAKKSVFTMAETQSKFNTSLQQAQENQAKNFLSNRQPSFAKSIKQEPQNSKHKTNLHVETKLDRTPQKDCLTADSVLQKKPLIEVVPTTIQTQTRNTITNERNQSKTSGLKEQELKPQELAKVKEYIYADPGVNIGKGKYGPVDLIIVGGKLRALKRIRKDSITNQKRIDHVKAEKKILNFLHQNGDRDFIVKLYDTFTDNDYICFVFEYLAGQDLFWVLQNEHNLVLGKQEAGGRRVWVTFYCAEILVALSTLHSNNIVYRDLKPDNIMIDNQGHIKLIDFGFSKSLGQNNDARTYTNCGTLGYTAPEVIAGQGYTYSADLWSFGIVIAELLSGSLPFEEKNDPMAIQQAILQGDIKYQREGVDNTARDLLSQIFVIEPNLRIPLERIKQHKFFLSQQMQGDQNLTTSAYWKQVQQKKFGQVPYKPNPMKYQYLLQNTYERISNLQGQLNNQQFSPEDDPSPNSRGVNRGNSPLKKTNMLGNFTIYRVNKEFENF